jgi:hypothetical protein
MGWRSDQAYEEKHRRAFVRWKASLGWPEYLRWQWLRSRAFLAGAACAVGAILIYEWLS